MIKLPPFSHTYTNHFSQVSEALFEQTVNHLTKWILISDRPPPQRKSLSQLSKNSKNQQEIDWQARAIS